MAEITTVKRDLDPKALIWPLIILLIVAGTIWGIINYFNNRKTTVEPTVELTTPVDGESYDTEKITVQGKTNSTKVEVSINGNNVSVAKDGAFSTEVPLKSGTNTIGIVATTTDGKKAERNVTVYRKDASVVNDTSVNPTAGADLSNSGPETLWIPEASMLALAAAGYYGSKKRLKETIKKS